MERSRNLRRLYIVEKILGRNQLPSEDHFLIKWKGYKVTTWEPMSNLESEGVRKMVRDFNEKHAHLLRDSKKVVITDDESSHNSRTNVQAEDLANEPEPFYRAAKARARANRC